MLSKVWTSKMPVSVPFIGENVRVEFGGSGSS